MLRYITADDGSFIDPLTGAKISVEELMEGEAKDDKDKNTSAKKSGTGKKTLRRQVET